jgi:membrane protease subunit HflK
MPWSNQSGGGGWKGGGPWGQGPSGGGGHQQQPDLEQILKRSQDKLKQALPGGGLPGPLMFLIGVVAVAIVGFYAFTFKVDKEEAGIVLRFGKPVREEPPGLHWRLPYPIEEVRLPKVERINQVEVGFRSFSGRDEPKESLMLTSDENIVDIDFVVQWRIANAREYLFNIQKVDQTVKDVAESAMREVVGRSPVTAILAPGREPIEVAVRTLMQQVLESYKAGIRVTEVKIQAAQAPQQVRAAFDDVVAAIQDRDRAQNEARAYANKIVPEARGEAERILNAAQGYREQTVAEAQGQAARFLKVYEEYRKAPEVTRKRIFLETMERVFTDMDKIIIDGKGQGGAGGVVPYLPLHELQRPKQGN